MLLVVAACSVDNNPNSGLMVLVDSDLATPKDLDRVHVMVTQSGETLLDQNYAIGSDEDPPPLNIPIVFRGDTAPAHIDVTGYRLGQARVERTAVSSIPTSRWAMLRLRLNYLCLGRLASAAGGEACASDQTCVQGECAAAMYEESTLPDFQGASGRTQAIAPALGSCFDAVACFENASEALLRDDCSFEVNSELTGGQLNVALRLPRGSVGTCGEGACFVPFDQGPEGYAYEPGSVRLPNALCERARNAEGEGSMTVVFSNSCATKTAETALCDETSHDRANGDATGMSVITGVPGSSVGPACDGGRIKSCGMCGTQQRSCVDGTWGEFGVCGSEGECKQNETRPCAAGGQQTCGGDCRWGECLGQLCRGNASQACERCGTQARECDNGVWAQWGECTDQRACSPGETQSCGSQGTQACGGNCEWGPCGDQVCPGAPTEACGMCGTRSRECSSSTGQWSEFGECSGQGACMPNDTRECGRGGTQVCGGNCQWSPQCTGQICEGERSMACGNCGTRTRTCDTNTGTWSEWSPCTNQGECSPDQTRGCGRGGTQVCNGSCRWDSECTGQSCIGAGEQACANCGVQTRSCDGASGTWSDWSSCRNQGECRANAVRSCGASGSQVCGSDCRWESACSGQMCQGDTSRPCGNCGVQRRTCDPSTGRLSEWGACEGQGRCAAGETRSCGSQGTQTCGENCQWQTACTGQVCAEPADRACGNCGTQTSTCDPNTGRANWSTCRGEGQCEPGTTQTCGSGGVQVCGDNCRWAATCSMQVCTAPEPRPQSCGNCGTRTPMCDTSSGEWVFPMQCGNQGACMPQQTRRCGPNNAGTSVCGDDCQWSACSFACSEPLMKSCGLCDTGVQMGTCDTTTGRVTYGACIGGGQCTTGEKQTCRSEGRPGSRTCRDSCSWPETCTPDPIECTAPLDTPCGDLCGVRSGTCDMTRGERACVEQPGACQPMAMRTCSDATGSGNQTCRSDCTWEPCVITTRNCIGAADAPCGPCNDGRTSQDCDDAGMRTCRLPQGVCDPAKSEPRTCTTPAGDPGNQSCVNGCRWSECEPLRQPCTGNAGDSCGLCGLGRLADSCLPGSDKRACEISSDVCDPRGGSKTCTTPAGESGTQSCRDDCTWADCAPARRACIGNAGDACGLCGQGRLSESCNAAGTRTCEISRDLCDPASGTRTCTTVGGDPGNQSCDAVSCTWTGCVATVKPCNGTAGAPCGPCGQGRLSERCDDTPPIRTCEVSASVCDPATAGMKACVTRDGRSGDQTCGATTCAWGDCIPTAAACIGNAGDPCGPCNLGGLAQDCDPVSGARACRVPAGVCEPGTPGGNCEVVIADGPTLPGHQVCTQSCAFECQADPPPPLIN